MFTDGELEGTPDNISVVKIPHYGFPETFHKTFEEILKIKNLVRLLYLKKNINGNKNIVIDNKFNEYVPI